MPKMKTHSGAKKRFRKTGSGKLRGKSANTSHLLEKKSARRKRKQALPTILTDKDTARVNQMLGGKK